MVEWAGCLATDLESPLEVMLVGQILDGRFLLQGVIGQGSFCTVYQATDQHRLKPVAVKVLKDSQMRSSFLTEVKAMQLLRSQSGIPHCYSYGTAGKHHYLAMELMSTDIMRVLQANGPFPACLLVQIAIEAIKSLEKVHSAGLLHLDLKPDNLGVRSKHGKITCFLLDFGLSERYINNGQHWKYSESYPFHGNAVFASSNILIGRKPSRRDDLESLIYVLVYLAKASLPWSLCNSHSYTLQKAQIAAEKDKLTAGRVCRDLPFAFARVLEQVRALRFEERPGYEEYVGMLERERVGREWDEGKEWQKLLATGKSDSSSQPALLRSLRDTTSPSHPFTPEQHRNTKRRLTKGIIPPGISQEKQQFVGRRDRNRTATIKSAPIVLSERMRTLLRARTMEQPSEESP